jgi:hypothetical protein
MDDRSFHIGLLRAIAKQIGWKRLRELVDELARGEE